MLSRIRKFFTILVLLFLVPISGQDNSQEIMDFLNAKDWQNAETAITTAIEKYPEKEWLYTSQVWVKQNLEKYDDAIQIGRVAYKKWPESVKVKEALARILSSMAGEFLKKENPTEAMPLAKEAYSIAKLESVFIWYGIALKQSEKYKEANAIFEEGIKKFPNNQTLTRNYAAGLSQYAQVLQKKGEWKESQIVLEKALTIEEKDSFLFQLAVSYREQKNFTKAIALLEQGLKKYPDYALFSESLPYTRHQAFQSILDTASTTQLKSEVEKTIAYLDKEKSLRDQFHYTQIISTGLRKIGDMKYFEKTYSTLLSLFPKDPDAYDRYGFEYYANLRLKGQVSKEDREKAIESRRKALTIYEENHPDRKEILEVAFPLKGRYLIISQFRGSGMTHNGYGNYCYDFMAVNNSDETLKPRTSGKKNEDYYNFAQPVYAIEDGAVEDLLNTEVDNKPGDYTYSANYISIKHDGYTAFYAHLKQNSSKVQVGDKVKKGTLLGLVGNSGMSTESHLHFCLNDANWVSLPFRFKAATVFKDKTSRKTTDPYLEGEIVEFR